MSEEDDDISGAHRVRSRFGIAIPLLIIALSACAGTSPSSQVSPNTLQLSACKVGDIATARCGRFSVLENPAKPQGRHISLGVIVLPAYGSPRAADPLFYFAGGPGGAASHDVAWAAEMFKPLNGRHDLVFIDQRGTGSSNAITCPELMGIGADSTESRMPTADDLAGAARACSASVKGADPTMYTTANAVDDFDQVRAALGYQSIDIYGGSYGVSSGLAYIQRHPDHVRAAVFDSGSLLDVRLWERGVQELDSSLKSVLDRCAADVACHAAFPSLARELTDVTSRLDKAPVQVDVQDKQAGKTVPVTINKLVLVGVISEMLSTVADMKGLPLFIHRAYLGEWPQLAQQYADSRPADNPQTTAMMARTIECSDEWARMDPERIRATGGGSLFSGYVLAAALVQQGFCAAWPSAAGVSGPVRTDAPIVFLNGTADSADPPANVADAPKTMPNSLLVEVPGYGHGQLSQDSSGCFARRANTFIDEGVRSTQSAWACALFAPFPPFTLS